MTQKDKSIIHSPLINNCVRYMFDVLRRGSFDEMESVPWHTLMNRSVVYECYKGWCVQHEEMAMPVTMLNFYLRKIFPLIRISRIKDGDARVYAYVFPPLAFAQQKFTEFVEESVTNGSKK